MPAFTTCTDVSDHNQASGKNLVKNGFQYLLTKTKDWGFGQPTVSDVYTYDC